MIMKCPELTILKTQAQDIWEQLFQFHKPKEYSDTSEYHPSYTWKQEIWTDAW